MLGRYHHCITTVGTSDELPANHFIIKFLNFFLLFVLSFALLIQNFLFSGICRQERGLNRSSLERICVLRESSRRKSLYFLIMEFLICILVASLLNTNLRNTSVIPRNLLHLDVSNCIIYNISFRKSNNEENSIIN